MRINFSKQSFLFLAFACTLLFSCKKEDDDNIQGNVRPEDVVDEDHVALTGLYGIHAIFPAEGWTNSYLDTFPEVMHEYYDKYRSNAVFAARVEDKIGDLGYDSEMYIMRFYMPVESQEKAKEVAKDYRSHMYGAFEGLYYSNISTIETTHVGKKEYEASYFEAQRTESLGESVEHVYIIYNNKTLYGVNILLAKDKEEDLDEFLEILKTLELD